MLHNYKLLLAYDGTAYCGWQKQPNGISIQEVLQEKASIILRRPIQIIGSGRTDAGVHARGQVANFHFDTCLDLNHFHYSLNGLLPKDIRVNSIVEVPQNFHARYSAMAKTYHYYMRIGKVQDPFQRLYCYHIHVPLNIELLKEAAKLFIGTHDFISFANEAHKGVAALDSIRTLYRLDVVEDAQNVCLEFEGDGFLYKMVRNIVGLLIEIASGKRAMEDILEIFSAKDRRKAGQAAPPHGLFLMHVSYPEIS